MSHDTENVLAAESGLAARCQFLLHGKIELYYLESREVTQIMYADLQIYRTLALRTHGPATKKRC